VVELVADAVDAVAKPATASTRASLAESTRDEMVDAGDEQRPSSSSISAWSSADYVGKSKQPPHARKKIKSFHGVSS